MVEKDGCFDNISEKITREIDKDGDR